MSSLGKLSAEGVTLARAIGSLELDPGLKNPDHLAPLFLRPSLRALLLPGVRHGVRIGIEAALPGAANFLLARTRALDAFLERELLGRPEQLVILGAGLDSRPYRFAEKLEGVRVFEVDLPSTGKWKQARLRENGLSSAHVIFVGIDFAHQQLDVRLRDCGYVADARTVFLWEGVTYYLPEGAVRATLGVLAQSAPGSALAFDFALADALENPHLHHGARTIVEGMKSSHEPLLFGLDPDDVAEFLLPFGFAPQVVLPPAALAQAWLPPAESSRMSGLFGVVEATRFLTKNSPAL